MINPGSRVAKRVSSGQRLVYKIRFGATEDAYNGFKPLLKELIADRKCRCILDVGGGAQPQLSAEDIEGNGEIHYTVMDISEEELALAPDYYEKIVMDISGNMAEPAARYDLVFSRFVAEHVADARQLHLNVLALLRPGGVAVHFFPTLFAIPFVANWILPEWLSVRLLSRERQERGKFPARYRWCIGPTKRAIKRYEELGYEVVEYAGFFGHGYYDSMPWLRRTHAVIRSWLLHHPVAYLTSFAWVILRKPSNGKEP
jgi:SAM-dependent methyltransferase